MNASEANGYWTRLVVSEEPLEWHSSAFTQDHWHSLGRVCNSRHPWASVIHGLTSELYTPPIYPSPSMSSCLSFSLSLIDLISCIIGFLLLIM